MSIFTLGIDTSNYTTSLSVCRDGEIVENVKLPLPISKGSAGLRQSDAVFAHTKNLPAAFGMLEADLSLISAVGYSARPRDMTGSYMPCFLCGENAAAIVSRSLDIPVYSFSHQAGHIEAALYSSQMPPADEFYAYHLSGGTFELLDVKSNGISYNVDIIGGTKDTTAGQIIDRVGVMLGLDFPCGPGIERLAYENREKIPKIKPSVSGTYCNLSGLQNIAEKFKNDGKEAPFIASYTIEYIKAALDIMTENAMSLGIKPLLFSGGVASNAILKEYFTEKYNAYFAKPAFSSDNAAGIALLTYKSAENEK